MDGGKFYSILTIEPSYILVIFTLVFLCAFIGIFTGNSQTKYDIRFKNKNKALFIGYSFFSFMLLIIVIGTWIEVCNWTDNIQFQMLFLLFIIGIFTSLVITLAYAKDQILDETAITADELKDTNQSWQFALIIMLTVYFCFFTLVLSGLKYGDKIVEAAGFMGSTLLSMIRVLMQRKWVLMQ